MLRLEQGMGEEMCAAYRGLTVLLAHYREKEKQSISCCICSETVRTAWMGGWPNCRS